jgi:DNA invertase Pin-like site-specific DNA recombinase
VTLRYNDHGKPVGLDWSVCNDGNSQPEVWGFVPKKKGKKRQPIMNPGIGRGGNSRLPVEIEEKIIEMYTEKEMAAIAIAKELGSTAKTVFRVLRRNDIPTRTQSRSQELRHARSTS